MFDIASKQEHVQLIIYGSSIIDVLGYLENEPYLSLANNIQSKQEFQKITIDDPPIPSQLNPSFEACCRTKIYEEQLAQVTLVRVTRLTLDCI